VRVDARNPDEWADVIREAFAVPLVISRAVPDFRASLVRLQLAPGVSITEVITDGVRQTRTPRLVRSRPSDDVFFTVHLEGEGIIRQDDRAALTRAGEGVFYDASQPYDLDYAEKSRKIVVQIARRELYGNGRDAMPTALPMAAATPSLRVLRATVTELVGIANELDPVDAESMGLVVIDLLAAAVASSRAGHVVSPTIRAALLRELKATVAAELGEANLSPAYLAARHHVSLRYLQALFAEDGSSPAAYIREQRLSTAYRQLGSAQYAHLPIAAIAYQTGFADLSTFTRAFRRRFDQTPTDRRERIASERARVEELRAAVSPG
jgi:AraC-like DNA-binding protein